MKTFKEIAKASLWGMLLLLLLLALIASSVLLADRVGSYYTSKDAIAYKKTHDALETPLAELDDYIQNKRFDIHWNAYADTKVLAYKEFIDIQIQDTCPKCRLYFSLPTDGLSNLEFKTKLESLSTENGINSANSITLASIVSSVICFLLTVYLIVGTFKYRTMGANGLSLLVLLVAPFLIASLGVASLRLGNYMEPKILDGWSFAIVGCIVYLFLAFPPIVYVSRIKGYKVLNILRLKQAQQQNGQTGIEA